MGKNNFPQLGPGKPCLQGHTYNMNKFGRVGPHNRTAHQFIGLIREQFHISFGLILGYGAPVGQHK